MMKTIDTETDCTFEHPKFPVMQVAIGVVAATLLLTLTACLFV